MTSARSTTLRQNASAFCKDLVSAPSPSQLLSTHFSKSPTIREHGPSLAQSRLPFLHKTFHGSQGCELYFSLLSSVLEMNLENDSFPSDDKFVVDEASNAVSVVGKGHFMSKKSGKDWHEDFIYRFSEFDNDGKIGRWEIWADPLSAWLAVGGNDEGVGGEQQPFKSANEEETLEKLEEAGLGGS